MADVRVIFVEPSFPSNQRQFVRGLAEAGAEVIGIGESPQDFLDDELKSWLTHYHQVRSVVDVDEITHAVRWLQDRAWIDRQHVRLDGRGGAGAVHDPGNVGADHLAVPGQAVDEAGAARGRGADGCVHRC